MLLPCQLNVALDHDCRTQNEKHVPCEKRITKTQELWKNIINDVLTHYVMLWIFNET